MDVGKDGAKRGHHLLGLRAPAAGQEEDRVPRN